MVIGLEVHAELSTRSKLFCGCSTAFGAPPNTQVCPVCLGLPGVLPVLNERAVELAVKAGLALHCQIAPFSKFDRKNYFYPDLPKAYQISQYDLPLCRDGYVEIAAPEGVRRIGIVRVHLEEEAGKSVHSGESIVGSEYSNIDYNRVGIPLIEIVSQPDLRSPEEARAYLEQLRTTLRYIGVSDVRMEEGSLRCDANISLRPRGSDELGTKTEVKNMNSFRAVARALAFEARRQAELLRRGERVVQETRAWSEARQETVSMRSKEEADDYRYFPEPDLAPLVLDPGQVERWRAELPELPDARRARFVREYGLPPYDAGVLTGSRIVADFFEAVAARVGDAKLASNWVMGEVLRHAPTEGGEVEAIPVSVQGLAELLELVKRGTVSQPAAKEVLEEMVHSGRPAGEIVRERGLEQISDRGALEAVVDRVIHENPKPAADVRAGEGKAIGFLMGQVMKQTQGKANPQQVRALLEERLRP
ncbi:aspartyl/glutamyl-tRNA amidotransferase subunit B [Limnochorda pilosa]|uniref:Aspartyl/glutamyl-tRNA(Asn/Gln) amidotransferase subunit B n=1 Tax=Limnochorda pilosa TaxID=1555112 RepID=A0A0K2SND0_LIMPI|nr:aspartyl/glutamyl-tRNA amidotransferase subunit B [Limnochorda pilosa]